MTREQVSRVEALIEEKREIEAMLNALEEPYTQSIRTISYNGHGQSSASWRIGDGDEIHTFLLWFFKNQLAKLEKELDDL